MAPLVPSQSADLTYDELSTIAFWLERQRREAQNFGEPTADEFERIYERVTTLRNEKRKAFAFQHPTHPTSWAGGF